jgi:hypothetical protein
MFRLWAEFDCSGWFGMLRKANTKGNSHYEVEMASSTIEPGIHDRHLLFARQFATEREAGI